MLDCPAQTDSLTDLLARLEQASPAWTLSVQTVGHTKHYAVELHGRGRTWRSAPTLVQAIQYALEAIAGCTHPPYSLQCPAGSNGIGLAGAMGTPDIKAWLECPQCGRVGLTTEQYRFQLCFETAAWQCPQCKTASKLA